MGTVDDGAERGACGLTDQDQRVRTLGAAALDLVDQAINHPGLFEGVFDQAWSLLSRLRGEGDVGFRLNHVDPSDHDVLRFYSNMLGCDENVLRKKWFQNFHPILAVASGQDLKDELTPSGELKLNVWRCIHHMLSAKREEDVPRVACEMETYFRSPFCGRALQGRR